MQYENVMAVWQIRMSCEDLVKRNIVDCTFKSFGFLIFSISSFSADVGWLYILQCAMGRHMIRPDLATQIHPPIF